MSRPMKHLARLLALALFFTVFAAGTRDARADSAAAQALFDAAKQLMAKGKYAEACPKLEESQRLDPGLGTQFNLASCYEQVGKTASAWSMFLEVAGAARAAGQADREKVARQRAGALEPKLVRLTITAPASPPADLQVKRDGVAVGKAQLGIPVPIDPGKHTIEATASGKSPFSTTVESTRPGASETVAIPPLGNASPGAATGPVATARQAPTPSPAGMVLITPPPAPAKPEYRRRSKGMMAGGIVMLSLGAISALTGGLVLAVCSTGACDESTSDGYFDENGNYIEGESTGSSDANTVGAGLLLVGLGGIGGGIALTVIGAKKVPVQPEVRKASATPELLLGPTSVGLRWTM
jgi:hypothetical protein